MDRKESSIFTSAASGIESRQAGAILGSGTYFCLDCGSHLALRESDSPPECPRCGGSSFRRDSIFEAMQDHGGPTAEHVLPAEPSQPGWLAEARDALPGTGRYLACCEDDDEVRVFPLERGWTRIGRSATADIRLDDPSVSRRHALIVSEAPQSLRILDDRSLNGVLLNSEAVEWARLGDGDELTIGRYRLFVLEA